MAREDAGRPHVDAPHAVEDRIEEPEEDELLPVGGPVPEEHGAEGGREGERADRGEDHRRGERDGELLVDLAREAAEEGDGHEDAEQHERGGDHGARHVLHRLDGGLLRVEALLHERLDALHHHNRVVHHGADREDESEQREDVDGVAECRHEGEGGEERDGDRDHGHERGAQVLEEDPADERDEGEREEEREDDLLQARAHVVRGVVGDEPLEVAGEAGLKAFHLLADEVHRADRVAAGELVELHGDRNVVVEGVVVRVALLAELGVRHVLQAHEAALRVAADDDLAELLGRVEAPLRDEREDARALVRRRRRAHRAERGLHVLRLDGGDDLLGVDALRGAALRVEPHAHRHLRAVDRGVAHAGHAQEGRLHHAVHVVRHLDAAELARLRAEREDAELVLGGAADAQPRGLDLGGQLRERLLHAVLHLHERHVAVRADLERDAERVGAVVGAGRRHEQHVLHAVHLVLERRGDGVHHLGRVRAGVGAVHHDARRLHFRVLRHGQLEERHRAGEGEDDRDDAREARTLDEEAGERVQGVDRGTDAQLHGVPLS